MTHELKHQILNSIYSSVYYLPNVFKTFYHIWIINLSGPAVSRARPKLPRLNANVNAGIIKINPVKDIFSTSLLDKNTVSEIIIATMLNIDNIARFNNAHAIYKTCS